MRRRQFRLARIATCIGFTMAMVVGANRDEVAQAQRLEPVTVVIEASGGERQVRTAQTTVGATLKEAGIKVGPLDRVTPSTKQRPCEGMRIKVVDVVEAIESVRTLIAFETVRTFTDSLRPGEVRVTSPGERGEKLVRYLVRYEDGVAFKRTLLGAQVVKQPTAKVVSIGSKGRYTSRGSFRTRKVMRMLATAYDPGPRSCGRYASGNTAIGLKAGYGVVAVDPGVIPMRSKLYIEGYGHAIAGDRGRSIRGSRIDLGFDTYKEAKRFGRKWVVVHVLE